LSLYLITGSHAAKTVNAFGEIGSHVRMAEIFFPVQVIFSFGISHIADTHSGSNGLEFAVVVYLAGEAI
jgi:hypothetical protein